MRYCAFLRGVNVNGRAMKMPEVCEVFSRAGVSNVSSVLATGNILFNSELSQAALRTALESAMSAHFAWDVYMFVKSDKEVEALIQESPFEPAVDFHVYAFVCESGFENTLIEAFASVVPTDGETAIVQNGFFYWRVAKGITLDAGFSKALGQKNMQRHFTSRNMNTLVKIADRLNRT